MRKAGEISARAHCRAMKCRLPGIYEYQLQAEIEHEFMASGATAPAYTSIVGGGKNGCILHYIENRQKINDGDWCLLMPAVNMKLRGGYHSHLPRQWQV